MPSFPLTALLRGPFHFLRPDPDEIRKLVPDLERVLPLPHRIYLEDEAETPQLGFPILVGERIEALRAALEDYLQAEERVQLALLERTAHDPKAHALAWERYRSLLAEATINALTSGFSRDYLAIFWLFHSAAVSRALRDVPRRLLEAGGAPHADRVKYRVFQRYLERVVNLTRDIAHRIADEIEEPEEGLFPPLLARMGQNILILTEDYVGPDLTQLASYFAGYLGLAGRDFRRRLETLGEWHAGQLATDEHLRGAVRHLLRSDPDEDPFAPLRRPGYASFLATHRTYSPLDLLPPHWIQIWEDLLLKLKEYELLRALRRLVVAVREQDGRLLGRTLAERLGSPSGELALSSATRPLDFTAAWVVDPRVHRFGLIYDMTDFSELLSLLRHSGREVQERSYRMIFRFQRAVNRLAATHRLKLEKYLGDGALYSGRHPRRMLLVAIHLQRSYRRALEDGFPFDRGLRIALNYGAYRLLPVHSDEPAEGDRYEFLGHGIVELSRLITGKASQGIQEIKNLLLSRGYPAGAVDRFFAPIVEQNLDVVDAEEERSRRFHAYINRNGSLINEGIVATEAFVERLDGERQLGPLRRGLLADRAFVLFQIEEGGEGLNVGIRKLGTARLKGLGALAVYEVVDGARWEVATLERLPERGLLAALDREFARRLERTPAV